MPLLMQWATAGKPWITSVSPKGGPPGETVVTLSGPGLQNRPEVYFKGLRSLKVTQNSDGSLSAAVPLGAEDGPITVRTAAGSHSSYTVFDVRPG